MKEENISQSKIITIKDLQKEIYQFITTKSKPFLVLPYLLRKQSHLRSIITVAYLLPLMNQGTVQTKPKQLIVQLLTDILKDSQLQVKSAVNFFGNNAFGVRQQLMVEIKNEVSLINILSKAISIPTYLLNLINDSKLNLITISIGEIQKYKKDLYGNILASLQTFSVEQQLVVINRLLILKQEQVVLNYFLKNNTNFIVQNFNNFSKQSNIIKNLYKRYITQCQSEQKLSIKNIFILIANYYENSTPFFMSLLNFNESMYYSNQRYKQFYYLLVPTNQNQPITKQLLQWWAISKQFIITSLQARVRCNLLAMIIDNLTKQDLYSKNYLISITQGIKKRITDGSSKDFASLIWKMLGRKIQIKLTQQIQKMEYFKIQQQHVQQKGRQQEQPLLKKPDMPNKSKTSKKIQKNTQQSSQQQNQKPRQQVDKDNQEAGIIQIQPKNIYDCILGLKNTHRKEKALKKLSSLIKRHKQDLTLMWNSLLKSLLCPILQQYIPILVELLTYKPEHFIESIVMLFMTRQNNISEKTYLIQIIKLGIQQLSTTQQSEEEQDQSFYFKKIKSTYYKQPESEKDQQQLQRNKQGKTRRWGHTRIAHQKANNKNISINFIKKQQSINRFYPVANLLYFKIIDIMAINPIDNLRSHQVYIHSLLKLLAVFVSNLKNHFDKYLIILDVSLLCLKIVQELVENIRRSSDRYEQTGGLTLMLTLQILNKISLIVDNYIPENVMKNIKLSIQGSKKLPNYGMSSVIDMIEANIYQRAYTIHNFI